MRTRRSRSSSNPVPSVHHSVLLHEVLDRLDIQSGDTVVDATLGGAGHAREIAQRLGPGGLFIGFDLDSDAIDRAQEALKSSACRTLFINANFRSMKETLGERGIETIDKAIFDLGWSSDQLEVGSGLADAGRGFSFRIDAPLLMTYKKHPGPRDLTASTIVNEWEEQSLADIIFGWGEERYARRIAKAIVQARAAKRIDTSRELAEIIRAAVPPAYARGPRSRSSASQRGRRIHPATRTFQALRIAVNDELGAIEEALRGAWQLLAAGGRIAVISFHSLEDRVVKRLFLEFERSGGRRVTKKPLLPAQEEILQNPRARSAKLRVIEKLPIGYDPDNKKNKQIQTKRTPKHAAI